MSGSARYVLCVRTEEQGDVEVRKVYQVVADDVAAARGYLRVVDESGEDYLYPSDYFVSVDLTPEAEEALAGGGSEHAGDAR